MTTPAPSRSYTPEDVEAMEDPVGYELVDGQLVERNLGLLSSRIASIIVFRLHLFLQDKNLGIVAGPDLALRIFPTRPKNFRRADVSYIRSERLAGEGSTSVGDLFVPPDLVVEVVSPNDLASELNRKVEEYLEAGVALVWLVYPDTRSVTVVRSDGNLTRLGIDATISGEDVIPGFECPVRDFFPED